MVLDCHAGRMARDADAYRLYAVLTDAAPQGRPGNTRAVRAIPAGVSTCSLFLMLLNDACHTTAFFVHGREERRRRTHGCCQEKPHRQLI